jgi:hypothetical protein
MAAEYMAECTAGYVAECAALVPTFHSYFFFKDNDGQNSLATALCAILHQPFRIQPQLLRHAVLSWEKIRDKVQQEVNELWRILMAATSDPSSSCIICVFNALDKCQINDQRQLIQKLEHFYTQAGLPT